MRIKQNRKWIFFFIVSILFFLIAEDVLEREAFSFDETISHFIRAFESNTTTTLFKGITNLISIPSLVLICLLIYLFPKSRKLGNIVVANLLTVASLNYLLKILFARERPIGIALIEESGYSFPSGHSMTSMAFFGFFIYLIYTSELKPWRKAISILGLILLIFLIGVSRIYLGVHYPSDVIGGFFLSIAYLILFTHLVIGRKNNKRSVENNV